MESDSCCGLLILFLASFPTLILQGYGCFHKRLLYTDECGDIGLFTECCFDHCNITTTDYIGPRKISDTARTLHLIAFVTFLALPVGALYTICCSHGDEKDDCDKFMSMTSVSSIIMYPVAGILCVVGCGVVALSDNRPESSSLGHDFYCSLAAGIYVNVQMLCLMCICLNACFSDCSGCSGCCGSSDVSKSSAGTAEAQFSSGAVATTQESGRMVADGVVPDVVATQVTERTETKRGPNGSIILRSLHLTSVVAIFRSE